MAFLKYLLGLVVLCVVGISWLFSFVYHRLRGRPPDPFGDQEYVDLMADLPFADEATAARLGMDAEALRLLAARTGASVRVLTLEGYALAGSIDPAEFPGTVTPDPDEPDTEKVTLEVLAVLVEERGIDDRVRALQDQLNPRGVQCLLTGRGPKDFALMFRTGFMPASRFAAGKSLLVAFPGAAPDPLLWIRDTNAANYGKGTADILAKLAEWHARHGIRLLGAGFDWIWLDLLRLPTDLDAFARDAIDFCFDLIPELVDESAFEDEDDEDEATYERAGAEALVARLRKKPTLFLWWD